VDQKENEADYEPDDWKGVQDALGEGFQFWILSCQFSVGMINDQ
jgi:hypothetical protein